MRQAGTLSSQQDAERFASFLLTLGISAKVEPADDTWKIWVRDENQVTRSKEELEKYLAAPHDSRYDDAAKEAKLARRAEAERIREARRNYVDMRERWSNPNRRRPVTLLVVAASVLVSFFTEFGQSNNLLYFLISTHKHDLNDIAHGEVWRLITPIFVHFGWLHLIFNMMWMFDLGTMIELQLRWFRYVLLVLVIGVTSNLAQFVASGPVFGGMSGVVFGLLGYAWVRSQLDPTSGLYVHPNTMFFMVIWFFVCLFNVIPGLHAANAAHGFGLAVGGALGTLPTIRNRLFRRR